jgi:hypothetical protein
VLTVVVAQCAAWWLRAKLDNWPYHRGRGQPLAYAAWFIFILQVYIGFYVFCWSNWAATSCSLL